jgi:chromosomal replication initiator protein
MIVDITEPDFESRVAIVRSKAVEAGVDLTDEVTEYIASSISNSVRELEGSLNTIICQIQLKNREISLQEVKNLIKNNIKPKKNISIPEVVKIVSDFYNIDEQSIYEKTRRKEIVKARQMVMFILREDFNVSYPLIGQKLGGKDHTTVIHSCTKIKDELKNDSELIGDLEQIRAMFS